MMVEVKAVVISIKNSGVGEYAGGNAARNDGGHS